MALRNLNQLFDARSEPDVRVVLEDAELSMGRRPVRLGLALSYIYGMALSYLDDGDVCDAASCTVDGATDGAAHDDVDGADDGAGGDGTDVIGGADATHDYADGAVSASGDTERIRELLTKEPAMRHGMTILQVPGRFWGRHHGRVAAPGHRR